MLRTVGAKSVAKWQDLARHGDQEGDQDGPRAIVVPDVPTAGTTCCLRPASRRPRMMARRRPVTVGEEEEEGFEQGAFQGKLLSALLGQVCLDEKAGVLAVQCDDWVWTQVGSQVAGQHVRRKLAGPFEPKQVSSALLSGAVGSREEDGEMGGGWLQG